MKSKGKEDTGSNTTITKGLLHVNNVFTTKKLFFIGVIVVFGLLLLFFVILPTVQGSMHFLIVLSGSMSPEMNPGDIVVSKYFDPDEIKINDVITFKFADNQKNCITHRVINITNEYGSIHFQTKGDANEDPDQGMVAATELIGKVVFTIPYLGYLPHFAHSPLGFIVLIVLPGILIIIVEIRNIAKNRKRKA